jgi:hypothetical protein
VGPDLNCPMVVITSLETVCPEPSCPVVVITGLETVWVLTSTVLWL